MPLLRANRLAPYEQLETFERGNDHLLFDCHAINTTHLGHLIENKLIQASLWQQFEQHNIEMITVQVLNRSGASKYHQCRDTNPCLGLLPPNNN